MKISNNKRCPRCNTKVPYGTPVCPSCMLNYTKFDSATNAEAKNAIKAGEHDRVLMRKGCPSDVKKWKLLLFTILLGFTGAHYYYVGRYKMGMFFTFFFIVGLTNAILSAVFGHIGGELYQIFTLLVLIWGVVLVLWIIDMAKVVLNHFKIPVSREG
ncbi:MAG: TM2 domain-containing protein [Clostridiales bacterium]|nr:TM2 domain-containing protein [Clostridiales bacterium]